MKTLFRKACLLIGLSVVAQYSYSQINISRTDFEKVFKLGLGTSIKVENMDSVYVGQAGGPHVYDFSFLTYDTILSDTCVTAGSIPVLSPFPSDAMAFVTGFGGTAMPDYAVFTIDDNSFLQPGSLSGGTYQMSYPPQIFVNFPVTYNTNYAQTITHHDSSGVGQVEVHTITMQNKVDGYGTLKLPGGIELECLRLIKKEDTPYHYKSYGYFTKEGIVLMVETNNEQPDTGKVKVTSGIIGLYGDGAPTFVSHTKNDPNRISVRPNPSSDKVFIEYTLSKNSWVRVDILDIQGKKIKELKNGFNAANKYQITEDISKLNSGIYFISITTDEGVRTEKLVVQ